MPNGQELFELYVEKLNAEGVDFDSWENLNVADQRAWRATAEALEERSDEKVARSHDEED
jgi:hypothetical protein